ncbi:MAG: sigma-54 dependent transcriptional regulator [Pseudomonadota bacterium]
MQSILIVSKDRDSEGIIRDCFPSDCRIERAADKPSALKSLEARRYELIFMDIFNLVDASSSTQKNGVHEALQPFWQAYPSIEIIIMCPPELIREAVKAVKAGASNYLTYPLNRDEVKYVTESLKEAILVQSELDYLRDRFWQSDALEIVQTRSKLVQAVFENIRAVAQTKSTVLLEGETGTGKGVLAKLIHRHSNRAQAQFISVHCGAIPDTLLESELFGHEKGAFTGAVKRRLGKFEVAQGGTIFLDEIGTITPSAQIKLLQVLQDGIFQRVGGEATITANARVIAASNADLKIMCEEGRFRKDLFYRLDVFPIEIPSLRDRAEDIPRLVEGFLKKMNHFNQKQIRSVDPMVMEALKQYQWPGNIRELENLTERAYILETSSTLTPESFPRDLFDRTPFTTSVPMAANLTLAEVRRKGTEDIERNYLKEQLVRKRGSIKETADAAGITTRQLHKLMIKYGLKKGDFKS